MKRFFKWVHDLFFMSDEDFTEMIKGLKDLQDDTKEGGGVCKWISVEDRLPETSGGYLIFDYGCENASYQPSTNTWDSNHELDVKPTHWMPLPDPPQIYQREAGMSDLTKEDQARKEAGDKYFKADSRESWNLAIAGNDWNAGWQAACAYKQKRITELKDMLKDIKNAGSFAVCIEIATEALSEGGGDE